jgi:dipeptidyl aminopeptidase/acylaminoacyl peptidase
VSYKSPPVFIAHGTADPIVPYMQSVILYKKLKANRVKTELLTLRKGKHGKFTKKQNIQLSRSIWKFLNKLGI